MNFVRFTGWLPTANRTQPHRMEVGQIIERKKPCISTRSRLVASMRRGIKEGMEFSTAEEGDMFAIRRDK